MDALRDLCHVETVCGGLVCHVGNELNSLLQRDECDFSFVEDKNNCFITAAVLRSGKRLGILQHHTEGAEFDSRSV